MNKYIESNKRSAKTTKILYGDDFHSNIAKLSAVKRAKATDYGRECNSCKTFMPWDSFHSQPKGLNNKRGQCKKCSRKYLDNWRMKNPEKSRRIGWAHELKRLYGITIDEYFSILESQNNRCAICQCDGNLTVDGSELIKNGKPTKLHVDHDHNTGKVRGILCNSCNRGLGSFRDNKLIVELAVKYLSKTQ